MDTGGCHPGVYFTYGSYSNPKNFNVTTSYYLLPLCVDAAENPGVNTSTTQPPEYDMPRKHEPGLTEDVENMGRAKIRREAREQSMMRNEAEGGYTGKPTREQLRHNEGALRRQAWDDVGRTTVDAVVPKSAARLKRERENETYLPRPPGRVSTHDMNDDVPHPMTKRSTPL